MSRTTRTTLVVPLLLALLLPLLTATPTRAAAPDWSATEAALADGSGGLLTPSGGTLLVDHPGGRYVHAFGDATPTDTDDVELKSVSKWIAATVVMTLVEDGLVDLDQPVVDDLPSIDDVDPRYADITPRMLLSHTAGLATQIGPLQPCLGQYTLFTLSSCVALITATPLAAAPGTSFQYTGTGYQILGLQAEVVTGESWHDLVADRLTGPCGMDTLRWLGSQNPWIAGGVSSDIDDLATFVDMARTGGCGATTILGATSLAAMRANQIGDLDMLLVPYNDGRTYGLGVVRNDFDGSTNLNLFSHAGADGTHPWIDTGRGYSAVLLLDEPVNGFGRGRTLFEAILPTIEAALDDA